VNAGEKPESTWRLTDLIDVATLQSIQDTFARAFGIPTVIVDPAGTNATEITHRLSFCEDFTRASVIGGPRCHACDLYAMEEAGATGQPKIFECWNGLYDCAIPIAPKGEVLGYFLCGQIRTEPPDPARYEATAREIGVNPGGYLEASREVRVLPLDRYEASVESMHVLAQMIGEQAAAAIDNFRMLGQALEAKDDASRLMDELDSILKSLSDIGSQPNYRSTLEAIADNLARLIPSDSCLFYVLGEDDRLVPALVRDPYPDALTAFRPKIGEGILGKVAAERGPRLIADASVDPDYIEIPGAPVEAEAMIVVPMVHNDELLGVISLSRFRNRTFTEHEFRILSVLASTQAALAIENARMQERERELLNQYRLLADLGTELASARSIAEVKDQLLAKTAAIFHSESCFLATFQDPSEDVDILARRGRRMESVNLHMSGPARLASMRLRTDRLPGEAIFEAWADRLVENLRDRIGISTYLAEPLSTVAGVIGGLFVGWDRVGRPPVGERRILRVVAGAAGATLSNFAEHADTDSSLRRRVRQLQSLTFLAERITGLVDESRIVDELLRASVDVGSLSGACYLVRDQQDWSVDSSIGELGAEQVGSFLASLSNLATLETTTRFATADSNKEIVVILLPGETVQSAVAAVTDRGADAEVDSLLTTLASYGAMAIERARLVMRQHETIARLESANLRVDLSNQDLKRLLAVHTELTIEVLEGSGLRSVARSLARITDADVAILAARGDLLAESPDAADVDWSPRPGDGLDGATLVSTAEGLTLTAAPAVLSGEVLAWVVLRTKDGATEIQRAAIEHGALLTALELLRDRTTLEVETRLRGGLLEELFSGNFSEDMMLKQGLALGFDLLDPSRVILIEPASEDATRADVEAIFGVVSERARTWGTESIVTVKGNSVVVISKEHDDAAGSPFEEVIMESLSRDLPRQPVNVACGTRSDSLYGYRESHTAARRGLDLLRIMDRSGAVFSFRDAGVEHLLLQTNEPEIVVEFTAKYVDPLEAYDRRHSSELLRSLQTFYSTGMNLEKTARILHIHVSTLRYRLGKVEDLLHVDPRGQDRLDIELALRAARVLAAFRN
jgi:ligand-binding sensor protein/sugar diacid utilization regulator/putative methionine-R-sulfoxide reductase with GAF domain